jgi:YbbR domain-containing protein
MIVRALGNLLGVIREGVSVVAGNLTLGLLSLGLAVTIWFFVIDVESESRTDYFPGVIPVETVNVPEGLAVSHVSEPLISIRITADKDVWERLSTEDFEATADLSGVKQREASIPVRVNVNRGDVKIEQIEPARVTITLEPLMTRRAPVKVKLVGAAPLGYALSSTDVSPQEVDVSGPASLVERVDAVEADVNLTGIRVSLEQDFTLSARDSEGGEIEGVTLEPGMARVSLEIAQKEFSLVFIVNPQISGNVAAGYRVVRVEGDPTFVSVSASLEVLQSIDVLTTEDVTVDGAESDVVRSVKLRLPEGARAVGGDEVVVRVTVAPATGESVFNVAVASTGAGSDTRVTVTPPTVLVTLRGDMPLLQSLSQENVRASVDVSDLPSGTHRLAPTVEIPAGTEVVRVDPSDLIITVQRP